MCSHGAVQSWSIVVPAKRLALAKTRLRADGASSSEHDELVLALLADTVADRPGEGPQPGLRDGEPLRRDDDRPAGHVSM